MKDTIIQLENIQKNYQKKEGLKGIDLTVKKGEIFVLLGKNGAGKSTLFKILTGLAKPLLGEVILFNQEYSLKEQHGQIGFNINDPVFYEHLSAEENLAIHCEYMNASQDTITFWLQRVGLVGTHETPVKDFSTGMRQRLALARCFVHNPQLIIIDEQLNGLDPKGIKELRYLLEEVIQEGKTILMSSHILAEVEAIATQIAVIADGQIVLNETKEQLQAQFSQRLEDYLIEKMEGTSL